VAQQVKVRTPFPTQGLYTAALPDTLGPEMSPWCQNVRFRFGQVMRTPGRSVVLDTRVNTLLDFFHYTNAIGNEGYGSLEATGGNNAFAPYNAGTNRFGTAVALPAVWSGWGQSRFSWAGGEDRVFVVRNSVPAAINFDGTTWSMAQLTAPAARFIEYFSNRVFIANLYGARMRVQWATRANYNDWVVQQGHSGWLDLYDGPEIEEITGAKVLNDRLVVYRRSSITDISATGDDVTPFLPQGRVYGLGCMAPFSLASAGQFHIFLANDFNVYVWDGVKLTAIGTPIHNYIRQILDLTKIDKAIDAPFGITFMGYKEYWLVLPTTLSGEGTVVLIYDYLRDTWTRDVLPGLTALYEVMLRGAVGTAGYDETGYSTLFPIMFAGKGTQYFMIDERVQGDRLNRPADGGVEMILDTPDMYFDKSAIENATLERVMISQNWPRTPSSDATYNLEISMDRGQTFSIVMPISPQDQDWGYQFVDVNATGNVRRYRLHYPAANGFVRPSAKSYTEIYVPSGEFFPEKRPAGQFTRSLPTPGLE